MKTSVWVLASLLCVAASAWGMSPKDIYKKAGPAVVLILGSDDGKQGSGGTGSIITPDGKVMTNAHVVLGPTGNQPFEIVYIFLKPDRVTGDNAKDLTRRFKGRVLTYSPPDELDLALVQIEDPPANLPTLAFSDPDKVDVGDEVVAIGHPEQGGLWTLTTGAISTVIANYGRVKGKNVFQTEASVNRGNSGGPLLDTDGNMVGINTMIARQAADGVAITAVNFSLKSSVAVSWLASLGMGLAYAPSPVTNPAAIAAAPQSLMGERPSAAGAAPPAAMPPQSKQTTSPRPVAALEVAPASVAPPVSPASEPLLQSPAAIVVVDKAPAKPAEVRAVADEVKKRKQAAEVSKGPAFDPAKSRPKFVTEKHPFSLDDLRRQQMRDLENMMQEMRGRSRSPNAGDGMGLW